MEENAEVVEQLETDVADSVETSADISTVSEQADTEAASEQSPAEKAFDQLVEKAQKKELTPLSEQAAEKTEKTVEPVKGLDPAGRGPNSWKADVREKFKALPTDVQSEVLRRENEHQKLMQESTQARKVAEDFFGIAQPYEPLLKSLNINAMQAFAATMNDAKILYTGDSNAKANWAAQLIKQQKIDINLLNDALEGVMKPVDPVMQELNQLKAKIAERENNEKQTVTTQVDQTISEFANNPENEFFTDVVADMQILLANGRAEDLKDAYDKACWANPSVRTVLQQRSAPVQQAQTTTPSVQQKLAASSSVKGAPVTTRPTVPKQKLEGRAATEAAWEALEKKLRM